MLALATYVYLPKGLEFAQFEDMRQAQERKKLTQRYPAQKVFVPPLEDVVLVNDEETPLRALLAEAPNGSTFYLKSVSQLTIQPGEFAELVQRRLAVDSTFYMVFLDEAYELTGNQQSIALLAMLFAYKPPLPPPVAPLVRNPERPKGFGMAPVASEIVEKIRLARERGETLQKIAHTHGLSAPTIAKYTRDIVVYRPRPRRGELGEAAKDPFIYQTPRGIVPGSPIERALTRFIASQRKASTRGTYYAILKRIFRFAHEHDGQRILSEVADLSFELALAYRDHCTKTNANPRTASAALSVLKAFASFCHNEGLSETNLIRKLKIPVVQRSVVRSNPISKDDVARLFDEAYRQATAARSIKRRMTATRTALAIHLLLGVGMRIGGLLSLRHQDLRHASAAPTRITIYAKSTADRYEVSIDSSVAEALGRYRAEYCPGAEAFDYIFATPQGRPLSKSEMRRSIYQVYRAVGLPTGGPQKVTLQSLRVTWATLAYQQGMTLKEIQRRLNHATIEQTCAYLRLDDQEVSISWLPKHHKIPSLKEA